jgi:protein phosphatase-4 regulatory subunit 3
MSFSRRVKVYKLCEESWIDLGTGLWAISQDPGKQDESIIVTAEPAASTSETPPQKKAKLQEPIVYQTHIRQVLYLSEGPDAAGGNYQRQQDTLIVWTEADGTDLALSFANVQGCTQVWNFIQTVRQAMFEVGSLSSGSDEGSSDPLSDDEPAATEWVPSRRRNSMSVGHAAEEPFSSARGLGVTTTPTNTNQPLPDPTMSNLGMVESNLRWTSRTPHGREKLASWVYHTDYIRLLCGVFSDAEDLEQLDVLHSLCVILQGIRAFTRSACGLG